MDKKEQAFQDVLYDFISRLPYCVYRVDDEDNELVWRNARNKYDFYNSFPKTRKALNECGIIMDDSTFWANIRKPLFLFIKKNDVMVGDGWISFEGGSISIMYNHWDTFDWNGKENETNSNNIDILKALFEQYLGTLCCQDDDTDLDYCKKRFGEIRDSSWKSSLMCVDNYLQNFKKHYIFQTYISKTNFIRICEDEDYLRLYADRNGNLTWDILSFMIDHVDFGNFDPDYKLSSELYNIIHFEPYVFDRKTKEKILELTRLVTKEHMNLGYRKADEDVANLIKSITMLINREGNLFEIKDYQFRFFFQLWQYFKEGSMVLSFIEDASHCSDFENNKYGDAHRSFLVVSKSDNSDYIVVKLIPSNKKYASYFFHVKRGFEQIAIALIVGYFKSIIDNKRQYLLIKPLFTDFGIVEFVKYK